ncbi:MAG: hypothetical protein BGP10_15815 [Rhodanobacter sp. 68-29]|nr:MAG: hypothetical protein ABT19_01385 [Rhodanobacter sp. SCN 68-63]OJY61372.1 MAG: hypothetical protein BGP10_15815 [Rhodanobacter sp. 68-29]
MDDGGWYCYVDMHVAAKGAAFKVASDFNCPGALSAADQCLDRIHAMLNSFDVNMSVNHDRGVIGMHAANQTGMAKAITHG